MRQGLDQPRGPPRVPGRREALASWPRPTRPHSRAVACSALLGTCGHRSGFRLRAGPPTRHPWLPRSRPGSATLLPGGLPVLQHLVLATSPDAETVTASLSRSVVARPGAVPSRGGMRGTCFLCGTEATPYLSVDGGWWVTLDLYGDRADVLTVVSQNKSPSFSEGVCFLGCGEEVGGQGAWPGQRQASCAPGAGGLGAESARIPRGALGTASTSLLGDGRHCFGTTGRCRLSAQHPPARHSPLPHLPHDLRPLRPGRGVTSRQGP